MTRDLELTNLAKGCHQTLLGCVPHVLDLVARPYNLVRHPRGHDIEALRKNVALSLGNSARHARRAFLTFDELELRLRSVKLRSGNRHFQQEPPELLLARRGHFVPFCLSPSTSTISFLASSS